MPVRNRPFEDRIDRFVEEAFGPMRIAFQPSLEREYLRRSRPTVRVSVRFAAVAASVGVGDVGEARLEFYPTHHPIRTRIEWTDAARGKWPIH